MSTASSNPTLKRGIVQILITTKFNKGDRVRFNLAEGDDVGTVTDVIVTRDDATEFVKVEYEVRFDFDRYDNGSSGLTFDAFVLDKIA